MAPGSPSSQGGITQSSCAQGQVTWVSDQCCPEEAQGADTPGCLLRTGTTFIIKKKMKLDMIQQSYACARIWRKCTPEFTAALATPAKARKQAQRSG